jgi:hypothetical protein
MGCRALLPWVLGFATRGRLAFAPAVAEVATIAGCLATIGTCLCYLWWMPLLPVLGVFSGDDSSGHDAVFAASSGSLDLLPAA